MGSEFGQWNEWNYDTSLQWDLLQWESHQGLQRLVGDLNHLLRREPALHQVDFEYTGFEWIDCHNCDESVLGYIRRGREPRDFLVVGCNFTPTPRWSTASACRNCAGTRKFLTATRPTTAAATSATAQASWPRTNQPRPAALIANRPAAVGRDSTQAAEITSDALRAQHRPL